MLNANSFKKQKCRNLFFNKLRHFLSLMDKNDITILHQLNKCQRLNNLVYQHAVITNLIIEM